MRKLKSILAESMWQSGPYAGTVEASAVVRYLQGEEKPRIAEHMGEGGSSARKSMYVKRKVGPLVVEGIRRLCEWSLRRPRRTLSLDALLEDGVEPDTDGRIQRSGRRRSKRTRPV